MYISSNFMNSLLRLTLSYRYHKEMIKDAVKFCVLESSVLKPKKSEIADVELKRN